MFDDAEMWNHFVALAATGWSSLYVVVGGRVTLARSSDQTLACIHFTSKLTRP